MSQLATVIAIGACSFELHVNDDSTTEIQVMPAGRFYPADGRPIKVPGWYIDAAVAKKVIERFNRRKSRTVIDYEHQTLHKEKNGQKAPAAAWFKEFFWREGKGLYATVDLTQEARDEIAGKKLLYFSPVFHYHPVTGEVMDVVLGAFTNTPAIDGMEELSLLAAATFGAYDLEDNNVTLLQALIAALSLNANATEEDALAALNKRLGADPLKGLREALGVDAGADTETLVAACTALKSRGNDAPDPSKYVPVSLLTSVQGEVAALNAKLVERDQKDIDAVISGALKDGRLLKPMESWARDLAKKDMAALNAYLTAAQPFAALNTSQTKGEQPEIKDESGLTDAELAVCSAMNLTPEEFKKAKVDE